MSALTPAVAVAVIFSALAVAAGAGLVLRPTRRLADRVRPYSVTARTSLGRSADVRAVAVPGRPISGGALRRLIGPIAEQIAARTGRYLDAASEEGLGLAIDQAQLFSDVPSHRRVQEYRIRQLGGAVAGAVAGGLAGGALGLRPALVLLLLALGLVVGATRPRAALDRAIEERRARMRIELTTVNQLVAMHVRVGGGVIQAVRRVVERGNGATIDELADVLRTHESGVPAAEAFARAARRTPEPAAARTYRLLAAGAEHGSDLASALLAHAEDVREARRETLRRTATKRRAAMLVPIIAVLAPVLLLFIAAPIPSLVFGLR